MNVDVFAKRFENQQRRLASLYKAANATPAALDLLPTAFKELGSASEELQMAVAELQQQSRELATTKLEVEAEHQRYTDLLEFISDGYLVTDTKGTIQEANRAAGELLKLSAQSLIGKPLIIFVTPPERYRFRAKLLRLIYSDRVTELTAHLHQRDGDAFIAAMRVTKVCDRAGKLVALRWLLRDVTDFKRAEAALARNDSKFCQGRPVQIYAKGEMIPLIPHEIFHVCQGLVKLSAFCDRGEEVIVGLVGAGKPFGIDMTSLPIYQATALADVELVSISVTEIAASPTLSHTLLPRFNQRQQQTELLLFTAGQRRVKDRLLHFLQLLKQEIGQPVVNGIRLNIRLTHEDLASACGTTRVTITRELGKLQQQGAIFFDSKYHIILRGEKEWDLGEKWQLHKTRLEEVAVARDKNHHALPQKLEMEKPS